MPEESDPCPCARDRRTNAPRKRLCKACAKAAGDPRKMPQPEKADAP